MDMRIEAAPMTGTAAVIEPKVTMVQVIAFQAFSLIEGVASFSCPTLGSHSLSAVAPDHIFRKEPALAGA